MTETTMPHLPQNMVEFRAGVFVDTSGWAHLVDASQSKHTLAARIYRAARLQNRPLVTSNYILVELVALLTSPLRIPKPRIVEFTESLKTSPHVKVIHIDPELDEQAWRLLRNRVDKTWSLVDCASFVIMERFGIRVALTSDHHFEQAGFVRLLK